MMTRFGLWQITFLVSSHPARSLEMRRQALSVEHSPSQTVEHNSHTTQHTFILPFYVNKKFTRQFERKISAFKSLNISPSSWSYPKFNLFPFVSSLAGKPRVIVQPLHFLSRTAKCRFSCLEIVKTSTLRRTSHHDYQCLFFCVSEFRGTSTIS